MPGALDEGVSALRNANIVNSKAYCEGLQEKQYSNTTNPHVSGSEAHTAWAAGNALSIGTTGKQGPCNITAATVVPNLVGLTAAVATTTLEAVGLVKGTTTLTTGPVASQLPAAAALARPGSAVNITLTS